MSRSPTVRSWLSLIIAIAAAFLAMWIVVPAPTRALLPLGVGAPEVCAWLLVLGGLALVVALVDVRRRWLSRIAALLAVITLGLASSPLIRFSYVADQAERDLRTALGGEYLNRIPAAQRDHFRSAPLVVRDLFAGLPAQTQPIRLSRNVPFAISDNEVLTVDIYRPPEDGRYPVLVQIYGGAWQRGEPSDHAEFAAYFATQGYTVFSIDYRHAPASQFPAQIVDVRRAMAWIGEHAETWSADTSRLALVGRSAGAHLAMLAAYAADAPRVRGVIDFYGPVDLVEGYRQPPTPDPFDVRDIEEKFLGGPPDRLLDRYREASPITLVRRRLPPTLLLYGGRDHIVEPRFGALLASRLRAEGSTVVHVEIPWAEHAFDAVPQGPSSQLARYLIERFLASVMTSEP